MHKYAVIVAGGSGTRMGGGMPKQFRSLCGRPVVWWSMKAFHDEDPTTRIILVLPEEFISLWKDFHATLPFEDQVPHEITTGGTSRTESVKKGLALVKEEALVAIHDGARPLVTPTLISEGWKVAASKGCAVPAVPVTDSLRFLGTGNKNESVNRDNYVRVQTPQVFKSSLIKQAYEKAGDKSYSDDGVVMENAGHIVTLFAGSPDNIKITNPKDLAIAQVLMQSDG